MTSTLFPHFKIDRAPVPNIEVSLLPLSYDEKQMKAQVNKKEELLQKKDLEPESPLLIPTIETNILIEEPKPLPIENRKLELGNEKEPAIRAMNISSQSDSTLTSEKENLLIAIPQSKVSHENPFPSTNSSEGSKNIAKVQSFSEEVIPANYLEKVDPVYPKWAKDREYQGEVFLKVQVFADGQVGKIVVKKSSGYKILDRSAVDAVKQWKFTPGREGNTPIWYWVNIPIKFQLQ